LDPNLCGLDDDKQWHLDNMLEQRVQAKLHGSGSGLTLMSGIGVEIEKLLVCGSLLIGGTLSGQVAVWDIASKSLVAILSGHAAPISALLHHGGCLFVADSHGAVSRWCLPLPSMHVHATIRFFREPCTALAADTHSLYVGFRSGHIGVVAAGWTDGLLLYSLLI